MPLIFSLNTALQRTVLLDTLKQSAVNRAYDTFESVAGKGINVLRSMKIMGIDSTLITCLGGGTGTRIEEMLRNEDLHALVTSITENTRTCTTLIANKDSTEIIDPSPKLSFEEKELLLQAMEQNWPVDNTFIFSGTTLKHQRISVYRDLGTRFDFSKAHIVVDCSGEDLIHLMNLQPAIVKINNHELADFLLPDRKADPKSLEKALFDLIEKQNRLGWILVTLGKRGALGLNIDQATKSIVSSHYVEAPTIELKNPIGSGDAFAAGVISLLNEEAYQSLDSSLLQKALVEGSAFAGANAEDYIPGRFDSKRVEQLRVDLREKVRSFDVLPFELLLSDV